MSALRPVEIVGGGLAGLSLGLALRRAAVPVTIFEAGEYPRHRVCGEFIAGLPADTVELLGLAPFLTDARHHRSLAWFRGGRPAGRSRLSRPALGLDRFTLDARLAEAFVDAGGELRTRQRVGLDDGPPGRVIAAGRRRGPARWIGLKAHVSGLTLAADLELHLGRNAYVGACEVGHGRVNVCGLFLAHSELKHDQAPPLLAYLRAAGLDSLARRVQAGQLDRASSSAVAALVFDPPPSRERRLLIGDAYAMIPPFTGHGMALAFQSAALALDPLIAWSQGRQDWPATVGQVGRALHQRFALRLRTARSLHRFLYAPWPQACFAHLQRTGLLPFGPLHRALHGRTLSPLRSHPPGLH